MLEKLQSTSLAWYQELGIGYYPVSEQPYDLAYFEKYKAMAETDIGKALNKARIDLVNKYTDKDVLDIGIGSGAFIKERLNTKGFDINPFAVEWLIENKLYKHFFDNSNSLTFWDSLEHIHNPKMLLESAKEYVFISCPIYDGLNRLLESKHFRKDEHCWYWTHKGLINFMQYYGFEIIEMNWQESDLGRQDIASFVFKRIG